jgi:nucleotide-binding universal stress UspA family protein
MMEIQLPEVNVKKILYATDLSQSAKLAFSYAVSLANLYQAGITILHVIPEDPDMDAKMLGYVSSEKWESIKEGHVGDARQALIGKKREHVAIKEVLSSFTLNAQSMFESSFVTDEIIVEMGNPVEVIVETAKNRQCDLIIMGSHGTGGLKNAMLGSTAQRVARRSDKPVLIVRLPEE